MGTSLGKLFAARSRNKSGVWQLNGKFMEGATRPRQLEPLWYNVELEREKKWKMCAEQWKVIMTRLHPLAPRTMRCEAKNGKFQIAFFPFPFRNPIEGKSAKKGIVRLVFDELR